MGECFKCFELQGVVLGLGRGGRERKEKRTGPLQHSFHILPMGGTTWTLQSSSTQGRTVRERKQTLLDHLLLESQEKHELVADTSFNSYTCAECVITVTYHSSVLYTHKCHLSFPYPPSWGCTCQVRLVLFPIASQSPLQHTFSVAYAPRAGKSMSGQAMSDQKCSQNDLFHHLYFNPRKCLTSGQKQPTHTGRQSRRMARRALLPS